MSDTATRNEMAIAIGSTFVWHEVYGKDSDATVDFYKAALGWEVQEMDMGTFKYKMLVVNGQAVAGVMGTGEHEGMENVPAHWATYIAVDDVDARLAKCLDLGATKLMGPMDVPTVGRMVLVQDPQGATFWLFKSESM